MSTILLTGASGFVGRHLTARLLDDGHRLRCLVQRAGTPAALELERLGAETVAGNILDPAALTAAAKGCDTVIHLVGIIFERRGASFEQIHVAGTSNALAAAQAAGCRSFIHMSALGTGPEAGSRYHQTKWRGEEAVRSSGLDYTIFRPSIIYGPGGEFIRMLTRQLRWLPLVPVLGDGNYRLQPISVFDVVECFARSLTRPAAIGQTYELGGPQALSYNQMIDTLGAVLGKRRPLLHLPLFLVRPAAALSEALLPRPLLTRDQLKMLLEDSTCDIGRMRRDLSVEPLAFAQGLARFLP